MTDLLLIGAGGHCASCIEVIESHALYQIRGIVDLPEKLGEKILGYEITGHDDQLEELLKETSAFLVTMGSIKNAKMRQQLFEKCKGAGGQGAVVAAGTAHVSKHADLDGGTIVLHQALVNARARVGENGIINSKALIEHGVSVGSHSHISTGAIVNGDCIIGERVFVGSRAVLHQGVQLCDDAIIGAGSVVIADINEPGVYVGCPARKTK